MVVAVLVVVDFFATIPWPDLPCNHPHNTVTVFPHKASSNVHRMPLIADRGKKRWYREWIEPISIAAQCAGAGAGTVVAVAMTAHCTGAIGKITAVSTIGTATG